MNNLYLFNYNNYYNRIVKFESTLADYGTPVYSLTNIALWNPNDGVNTTQVVNTNVDCDYCIITKVENGVEVIDSRWFVIEKTRNRNGQWTYQLRRDLIAENYNTIVTAPAFIEKATVGNSDPAVFNKEDMTFNQIKQSETLLQDETKSAWVVGYIPKDSFSESTTISGDVILSNVQDLNVENLSDLPYYKYSQEYYYNPTRSVDITTTINGNWYALSVLQRSLSKVTGRATLTGSGVAFISKRGTTTTFTNGSATGYQTDYEGTLVDGYPDTTSISKLYDKVTTAQSQSIIDNIKYYDKFGYDDDVSWEDIVSQNNKIVYVSSENKYYRIKINYFQNYAVDENVNVPLTSELGNLLQNIVLTSNIHAYGNTTTKWSNITGTAESSTFQIASIVENELEIEFESLNISATTTLTSDRYHLNDQPYDMFCIPYSETLEIYQNGTKLFNANKSIAVNMAVEIGHQAGSASVYDVQLLPYCPVRYMIKDDGTFDIGSSKVHFVSDGAGNNIGVICWAITSTFEFNIKQSITVDDYKISNETDLYRLVSPNFNGQFEFSPAMNGGVSGFNVDCTYKPYNPYIHVNPIFSYYYGQDFNDARGLICGGDFSLPQITSAWAEYEQNNKNYQQIFNREIQNMQTTNYFNNMQTQFNVVANSLGSALGTGTKIGGGLGVAGGAISGVASFVGGALDWVIDKSLQGEALNYKYDMYGYQLGNIQALPTSLAKTSAITANNKIFPMIEYYTCTDVEKEALKNKIKYNGMSVGRIGTIGEFIQDDETYIKAKLIRLEGINNDTHYLNEIANEVYKGGFYING